MRGTRTWTEHLLPFERLSPEDFEGVFQWLLTEEGYKKVRNLGEGGSDEGCDLVAVRDGRRVVVQCKRTRQLGPKAAVEEVEKVLALPADELPEEYVLAASCTLTLKTERAVRARVAGAFKCQFWALRELDERVRRHRRIVERFFGSTTVASGQPTIPPPTRDFAGRTDELEELRRAVGEHGGALIYGVRGLGGIGKTELGLKLVELVGDDYPDGHILVELDGASDHPLSSADAMASVVRAYEPQLRLPEAEADLRRMYHQVLKDRRAIVLLDDAAGAEQVEPLLPHTGCLMLVTSRQRFALPQLHRLDLDALTSEAARELLLSLAPRLGSEAERIAKLLGRLPLALRLAGSAFAERPDLVPEEYVRRLEHRGERVGLVEAAISFNYEGLEPKVQQQWRMLAVFPGDFDVAGAAAVWAVEADAAKEVLGGVLHLVSLVEWRGGRYRLHDLARDFAASLLGFGERRSADERHAGHYVQVLRDAELLYGQGGSSLLEGLLSFDTEWANIQIGQVWAAECADSDREAAEHCNRYQSAGPSLLELRLHPQDRVIWFESGLLAAASLGDRRGQGFALGNLGLAYADLGKMEKAIGYYKQAVALHRESGDARFEVTLLNNLGLAYAALGETNKAIGFHEQQLIIVRATGDWRGAGNALGNLGLAYADLGEMEKAIGYYEQQLIIVRKIGDRRGEGNSLGNLGHAYAALGDAEKAILCYEQQLIIVREIGDRRGEGNALNGLGNAYGALLGEVKKGIDYHQQAVEVARAIGDRRGEGTALSSLGSAHGALGEVEMAIGYLQQALRAGQEIKNPQMISFVSAQLEGLR